MYRLRRAQTATSPGPATSQPVAKEGSLDSQALTAAATLELSGFSPFRNRSTREVPDAGGDVGRVVGIGSPWSDMQVRKALMALANPLKPPPGNPPPEPKLGRSEAHACSAFWKVLFPDEEPEPPNPPKPPKPPGAPDGEVVGTSTPCCRRHERYAVNPEEDDAADGVLPDAVLQPATSSVARPATATAHAARLNPVDLCFRLGTILRRTALTSNIKGGATRPEPARRACYREDAATDGWSEPERKLQVRRQERSPGIDGTREGAAVS